MVIEPSLGKLSHVIKGGAVHSGEKKLLFKEPQSLLISLLPVLSREPACSASPMTFAWACVDPP